MLLSRILLLCALMLAAGCGQRPDEVVDEGRQSVDSWRKTLEMVCGQWADYRVPTLYVKQMFKAGDKALKQQLQELEKLGSDERAKRVVGKIHRLRYWIESHQKDLPEADEKKRREILNSLPADGEGP
jgi:hypothetical protein